MQTVRQVKYWQALNEALAEEMELDRSVCLLGEDIGSPGGAFGATKGLLERFGPARVRDTPISEAALTGLATGAAMMGLRPVFEVMFFDFMLLTLDQLINHAAKMHFMSGGVHRVPMTIMTMSAARRAAGPQHSQAFDNVLASAPGLHVVWPSNARDAKGLLKAAIRSDDPVVFITSLALWRSSDEVDATEEEVIPIGKARVLRSGSDLTLVGVGTVMPTLSEAATTLSAEGIDCEVVDLRCLSPLDTDAILESAGRTGRLVVAHDGAPLMGTAAAIVGHVATTTLFGKLRSAPQIVTPPHTPIPFNPAAEALYYPSVESVKATVYRAMEA